VDEKVADFYHSIKLSSLKGKEQTLRLFVVYVDDKPVGIGAFFIHAGIVGIFDVLTVESYHEHGIDSVVTESLIATAFEYGCHEVSISAINEA
ncbi:GNAT family N-acetyltransferase, partial [Escherichia coli]|uniref:GNAT family N-acetyltransferase n=1 Tax=Escherichia coli TaxID=562 RepID=UPI00200C22ED